MSSRIGLTVLLFLALSAAFLLTFSAAKQQPPSKKTPALSRTSTIFPVQGNVYPLGYYSVSLKIGNPAKVFDFDIDSGSDLTWVQCDAPCTGCTKPPDSLYKPKNNVLLCADPICSAVPPIGNQPCNPPTEQCDYKVDYADLGSSLGVLVKDYFPLKFTNGSSLSPRLVFGCGYDQEYKGHGTPPPTAGVLGLGKGKVGILSQLTQLGLTRNVVGHCFSEHGGGYLFFGDYFVPSSGISWIPISTKSSEKYYLSGPAELFFNGKSTGLKGLDVIFDSGSSYTYFNSQAYETVVNLVKNSLNGKPLKNASDDRSLPLCWKGNKAFKTVQDAKSFFAPIALSFTNAKNVQLQMPPEAYLIVSKYGNVCLGILNGAEVGLGKLNIIGDISMQGKMVIYDNEKQEIGWGAMNCDRLPNVKGEYDEDILQPPCAVAEESNCPSGLFYK